MTFQRTAARDTSAFSFFRWRSVDQEKTGQQTKKIRITSKLHVMQIDFRNTLRDMCIEVTQHSSDNRDTMVPTFQYLSVYFLSVACDDIAGGDLDRVAIGISPVVAFFFFPQQRVSVLALSVALL